MQVKEKVQERTSKTFSDFKASSYRTLVDYVNSRIIVFIKVQELIELLTDLLLSMMHKRSKIVPPILSLHDTRRFRLPRHTVRHDV